MAVRIKRIHPQSPAQDAGLAEGDTLLLIGGEEVGDFLDVEMALCGEPRVEVRYERGGEEFKTVISRLTTEGVFKPTGLEVDFSPRTCPNNCIFCFVDQNPPGLRESIYIKDEDYRLSFSDGAYITLTNLTTKDKERIHSLKISPLYISVHTINDLIRRNILRNPNAEGIVGILRELIRQGVTIHAQVVVLPGINDGLVLAETVTELSKMYPGIVSVAVVPVGLTRWRKDLPAIQPVGREEAIAVLGVIDRFQKEFLARYGTRFAFPADEFFIKAGFGFPIGKFYEGYPQIEDGVGLWTHFRDDFFSTADKPFQATPDREVTVVTSVSAQPLLQEICTEAERRWKVTAKPIAIKNRLFGETVNVAGLLAGGDIALALRRRKLGEEVLIPAVCVDKNEGRFIDDITAEELSTRIERPVRIVEVEGEAFIRALLGVGD